MKIKNIGTQAPRHMLTHGLLMLLVQKHMTLHSLQLMNILQRCKHCDTLIGAKRNSGTSALLAHLRRCKKRSKALKIVQDLSSTLRSPNGARLKDWSYDPDVSRLELTQMIALHEFPFLMCEYDGFRRFVESLNPLFKIPSRTTSRDHCMKDFASIARDVLAIPASSVASEAAFSTGKRIISDDHSSLAPETVEALICLQDWYRAQAKGTTGFSLASLYDVTVDDLI